MDAVLTASLPGGAPRVVSQIGWFAPLAFLVMGLFSLPIDVAVVRVFEHKQLPSAVDRHLKESLEICETFGHGFGAFLIVIAIGVLDPLNRRNVPWVAAGSFGSGLAANLLKLIVHRTRPRDFDLLGGTVWETFSRSLSGGAGMHSFPSAHTATAVGLAVMLAALYPRGRWYFSVLAFLVGAQRIVSSSHFPSDVFAGAAVGWIVGTFFANRLWSTGTASEKEVSV